MSKKARTRPAREADRPKPKARPVSRLRRVLAAVLGGALGLGVLLGALFVFGVAPGGGRSLAAESRCFPETQKCVGDLFYQYWLANGGLAQQGYPLTDEFEEVNPTDGKRYRTQYFERARFEHHPELAGTPHEVLLGLLGREQYLAKYPAGRPAGGDGEVCFDVTNRCVRGIFFAYWQQHGGLAQQGYPLSDEFEEVSPTNGQTYRVQYFERARFEHHPEHAGGPYEVLLGLLGREQYLAKYPNGPNTAGPRPQPIATAPAGAPTPTMISALPTKPNTGQPEYVPGQGFNSDARRVLDISALQLSLERYQLASGRYPTSLDELFPRFAPVQDGRTLTAPPVDPETRQPYQYALGPSGSTYALSAMLSTGERYTVVNRNRP